MAVDMLEINDEALALAENLAMAENLGFGVFGSDQKLVKSNPQFQALLGLPDDIQMEGMAVLDIIKYIQISDIQMDHTIDPANIPNIVSDRFSSGETQVSSQLARTQDGRRISINTWYNGKGEVFSCVRDISEDRRQRKLLELAMASASAGVWSLNFRKKKFTYSQSVLDRLSPREIEKMQTQGLWAIVHHEDLPDVTKTWQAIIQSEHKFDFSYRVVTDKDGEMWQRSVGQLERGSNGDLVGATAFVTDITNEVSQRNELLAERAASRAKSEFLARMSHEVRTPLNAIIGMADSLQDEPMSEDIREVIDDIEQAADGLHNLLSRTLDHAKLISNNVEANPVEENLKEIVDRCVKLWRPQCSGKDVLLQAHIAQDLPETMWIDGFRVQQCLNNLISNAVKFTQKGRIDLIVKLAGVEGAKSIVFAVKDTGIGMSEDQVKKVFTPFTQADGSISKKYGGTGLGMSIAKQLTELMGGNLRVKSVAGSGTTFAMVLPFVASEPEEQSQDNSEIAVQAMPVIETRVITPIQTPAPEMAPAQTEIREIAPVQTVTPEIAPVQTAPAETPPIATFKTREELAEQFQQKDETGLNPQPSAFAGLSVLCVEDNVVNQKVVKRLIGKKVSSLMFANNGREGLKVLETAHVDVVLMDIHMPVMNGIEATIEIRDSGQPWANVAIIALTADPDYQQKRICRNIGMNETVAKPVRRQDILDAFDRVLKNLGQDHGQKIAL